MKKLLTLILAVLMTVTLFAACGPKTGKEPEETTTAAAKETTTAAKETTPAETTPEETTPEETTTEEAPLPTVPEGLMAFYEDFDKLADVDDTEGTMQALGWHVLNMSDGALKDSTVKKYAIKEGHLLFDNLDVEGAPATNDSYVMVKTADYIAPAFNGNYVLQYDLNYTGHNDKYDRYAVFLTNYDGYNSYNSCHVRIGGYGNNQMRFMGSWTTYDAVGPDCINSQSEATAPTLTKKLFGVDFNKEGVVLKEGEEPHFPLLNRSITIRYSYNYEEGPTIYIRDNGKEGSDFILISKPDASSTGFAYLNMIDTRNFGFKVSQRIAGWVDNVAIWTGLGEMPADHSTTAYEAAVAAAVK